MPISLFNSGGAISNVVQAFSGVNFFASNARTKKIKIGAKKVELISGGNQSSPRRWLIFNEGPNVVFLFYGDEQEYSHPLPPDYVLTSDDAGGLGNKVSASSKEKSFVRVTIRGSQDYQDYQEEMPIPLKVKPFVLAGTEKPLIIDSLFQNLKDQDERNSLLNSTTTIGQHQINGLFGSYDGVSGYKFFELTSFQPGETYRFKVKKAESFNYDFYPVKCWALNPFKAIDLIAQIFYNQLDPSEIEIRNQAWRLKEWIGANIEALPGEFEISPDFSRRIFGLWMKNSDIGYEDGLIWNFDEEANEFEILGF